MRTFLTLFILVFFIPLAVKAVNSSNKSGCPYTEPGWWAGKVSPKKYPYQYGYYGEALMISLDSPSFMIVCPREFSVSSDVNLCKAGVYDAEKDLGKALRCLGELDKKEGK